MFFATKYMGIDIDCLLSFLSFLLLAKTKYRRKKTNTQQQQQRANEIVTKNSNVFVDNKVDGAQQQ